MYGSVAMALLVRDLSIPQPTQPVSGHCSHVRYIITMLPPDVIVYFLHHTETDGNTGRIKAKTIGKMLDNYVTLEGKFTIVLKTVVKDGQYYFSTQNNGMDTVKSPMGMFEEELIVNDLKMVDDTIREYYGIEVHETETAEE